MQVRTAPWDTRALGEEQAPQDSQALERRERQGARAHRAPPGRPASQASRRGRKQCTASEMCLRAADWPLSLRPGVEVPPQACRAREPYLCCGCMPPMIGKCVLREEGRVTPGWG